MGILIAIDVANLLHRTRHLTHAPEVVEEHKSRIEIDPFEDIVCDHCTRQLIGGFVELEVVVYIPNELISAQEMLVVAPLV